MRPALLYVQKNAEIAQNVFKDLHLDSIFSKKIRAILAYPCSEDELLARQNIFVEIKNSDTFSAVMECRSAIANLAFEITLWQEARTKLEKLFLRVGVMEKYLQAYQALCNLQGEGRLRAVANYFQNKRDSQLTETVIQARNLLICMQGVQIGYLNNQHIIAKNASKKTLFGEICDCAKALGFSFSQKEYSAIFPDAYFSRAFRTIYKEEIETIQNLLEPYNTVNFEEILAYLPELDFFIQIEEFGKKAEKKQITRCIPTLSKARQFLLKEMYDFTLLQSAEENIIPNNTYFSQNEPFFFLVGANGGGKTTYLRTVGSNLILFLAGCPVFAQSCVGYPFCSVRTHFPADERFTNIGRLDDEKKRIDEMLADDIADVFFLFNETFSGTNQEKGYAFAIETAEKLCKNHSFGLFVTHFHQVQETKYPILHTVIQGDDHHRTYRIAYAAPDGSSYAEDILIKYGMDSTSLAKKCKTMEKGG